MGVGTYSQYLPHERKYMKNKDGLTEKEFLGVYDANKYQKPSVTVDMLLFTVTDEPRKRKLSNKTLKLMLIKRGDHPHLGEWAIPGGFVNIKEGLSTACYRELKEETNVDNVYFEQLKTFGDDVYRDKRMRVLSVAYMALADKTNIKPIAGDDADDVKWFTIKKDFVSSEFTQNNKINTYNIFLTSEDKEVEICYLIKEEYIKNGKIFVPKISYEFLEVSNQKLAFDHIDIINYALERLKNKIEYTTIAFNLLPQYFTLREVQKVYEAILNPEKEFSRAGFQRKIKKMLIQTNKEKSTCGRHALCYELNNDWKHSFIDK